MKRSTKKDDAGGVESGFPAHNEGPEAVEPLPDTPEDRDRVREEALLKAMNDASTPLGAFLKTLLASGPRPKDEGLAEP